MELKKLVTEKQISNTQALNWMRGKIDSVRRGLVNDITRHDRYFKKGQLYFFAYDPKHKKTLPYYDIFPIVLVLDINDLGPFGLNLHYLPIKYRMSFLNKLKVFTDTNNKNVEGQRLRVTYDILAATKSLREFKPCVKQYLFHHMKSKIIKISSTEWDYACMLPVQSFKKEKPQEIWNESIAQFKGNI